MQPERFTDIMFGWQKPIVEAAAEMERMRVMLRGLNKEKSNPGGLPLMI